MEKLKNLISMVFSICGFFIIFSCTQAKMSINGDLFDEIKVKRHQEFLIELESHDGSGYSWVVTDSVHTKYLQFLKKESVKGQFIPTEKSDSKLPKIRFYFKAIRRGLTKINFSDVRPWDKSTPLSTKQFTIIIN